jgi:chemotaxis protein methyltransferase CheR
VRELIYQRAGISLHAGKQAMVYSRLSRRLRETGHRSFSATCSGCKPTPGDREQQEWQEFVNCLTTNLTSFFREEHHFHALVDDEAIAARRAGRRLRIWCNAASTGEEPYSLAMTVVETLGANAGAHRRQRHRHQGAGNRPARVYDADARGLSARAAAAALPARQGRQRRLHPGQARAGAS